MVQEREVLGGLPAGDVGPGIEIGGDSVKKPGPRNLSCSGPGSTGGGGNRRTPKKQRSRHNTNKTTHLRVPSGRQVPHVLQEEGAEDGVRLLRSPAPTIGDPWGPLSSMLSGNKDSGGEEPGSSLVIRPWLAEPLSSHGGKGQKGGGRRKAPGPPSPRHGGLCRGHRSRWKGPHLWRRPGFLFS